MTPFEEAVKKIGWDVIDSDGPDDRSWRQVLAKFADKGYARVLCTGDDPVTLAIEFAHPHVDAQTVCNTLGRQWSIAGPVLESQVDDDPFETLILLDKVVGVIASDHSDPEEALMALKSETPGESEPEEIAVEESDAEEVLESESDQEDDDGGNAFEEIGDEVPEESEDEPTVSFARHVERTTSHIDVALGFAAEISATMYGRLEETLLRNLRAKFDISARVITKPESNASMEDGFAHRLFIRILPDETGPGAMQRSFDNVTEYFDKILELASIGIDPLVFLGVSDSRASGVFVAPTIESLDVDESDDEDAGEVVLSLGGEHDSLKPGSFEDERLREPDATTALVDVVLRHPGYSDRNMSQVLSLLLSIEYHQALDIIARAPCIVAWGVARERALTMKTVIEGAGGKVHLAEPGTFDVD